VARTLPGKQFEVGRSLRARITLVFLREGITLHTSLNAADATGSAG
jgi:moderate conductance mechanosensitive channel